MVYELQDTAKVEALFAGWQETLIYSCLQKVMGRIWVTDRENPRSAFAFVGCFGFFAGLPDRVLRMARVLVDELSDADITLRAREVVQGKEGQKSSRIAPPDEVDAGQLTLFDTVREDDIIAEITGLELGNMTPIDALNTLYKLQAKLKNRV